MLRKKLHKGKVAAFAVVMTLFATLFTSISAQAVDSAPTALSPSALGTLYTNLTLSQPIVADGTPTATIAVSAGTLPDGLSLASDSILGTPTTAGNYSFTLTATNTVGSFSQVYTGVITNGKPGAIYPAVLPPLTAGVQSVVRFTSDGNPTGVITLVSGSVPAGMTYSSGAVSGTPSSPGAFSFTLRSTNAFGTKDVVYAGAVLEKAPTSVSPETIGSIYTNAATSITFSSDGIPSAAFSVSAKSAGKATSSSRIRACVASDAKSRRAHST